jgi:hypothetical protein
LTLTLGGHHVVTGAGQFAIAQPVGLVVSIAGIPNYVARDTPTPVRYKQLAFINLGNALGWQPRIAIEHIPQIFYPIQPEFTLIRHNLLAGETATIDEIATSTTLMPKAAPYDRSPTVWTQSANVTFAGGAGGTLWTYTVPAGRMLYVSTLQVSLLRISVATAAGTTDVLVTRAASSVLVLNSLLNTVGVFDHAELASDGLVLQPGEVLAASYFSADTGGTHNATAYASGYTFAL